jgi:hypothetical protein
MMLYMEIIVKKSILSFLIFSYSRLSSLQRRIGGLSAIKDDFAEAVSVAERADAVVMLLLKSRLHRGIAYD